MSKSVGDLLREAIASLERQQAAGLNQTSSSALGSVEHQQTLALPTTSTGTPTPDRRNARAEVLRLLSPYSARGTSRRSTPVATFKKSKQTTYTHLFFCLDKRKAFEIPTPSRKKSLEKAGLGERKIIFPNRYCTPTEFSDHLDYTFPPLKQCGGFQLLRCRGSTRSKALDVIPCSQEGYTPEVLCNKELGIGTAVIYIRPLQKDIDIKNLSNVTLPSQPTGPMVSCLYCGDIFSFSVIQGHVDCCEKKNTDSNAQEGLENTPGNSGTSEAGPSTAFNPMSSQSQAGPSTAFSTRSYQSPEENTSSISEDWKTEPDLHKACNMFRQNLLKNAEHKPEMVVRLDLRSPEENREREIITFYKKTGIDWGSPFSVILTGDLAVGDGVKRHFFSTVMEKIQFGFDLDLENTGGTLLFNGADDHKVPSTSRVLMDRDLFRVAGRAMGHSFIHGGPRFVGMSPSMLQLIFGSNDEMAVCELSDCPDTDVIDVVSALDSERELTPQEQSEVNHLAVSWDLPPVNSNNRRWLTEKILQHAVVERRRVQMKQLRKGLKDTGVLVLMKERPSLTAVLFPPSAEQTIDSQLFLKRIIWPMPDSDEEDDHSYVEETCLVTGFLRDYIENGSSQELIQLLKFWTGWAVPPQHLHVEVAADITMPVASTCMTVLKLPLKCPNYALFKENLQASVLSTKFGFGMV